MSAYNHLLHCLSIEIDKFMGTYPKSPIQTPTG